MPEKDVTPVSSPPVGGLRSLLLGGILPVVIFTVVEEYFGTLWGLVAGMAFGVGEIVVEWRRQGRVDAVTWIGNGMLIGLGVVSLVTHEGIWFKLQPSLLEAGMAVMLFGSVLMKRPLMLMMAEKQGILARMPAPVVPIFRQSLRGFTFRMGIFFLAHAALAAWAALHWSTQAWAILKGVGFTGSMIVYAIVETLVLRRRIATSARTWRPPPFG